MRFYIKEAREQAGFSQKELAEIVGVAPNTFHGYESGKHDPKSDLLVKIANACHVSVDFLLGIPAKENKKSPMPSAGTGDRIDPKVLEKALIDLGFIQPGEDLSESDLRFLLSIGDILRAWFAER